LKDARSQRTLRLPSRQQPATAFKFRPEDGLASHRGRGSISVYEQRGEYSKIYRRENKKKKKKKKNSSYWGRGAAARIGFRAICKKTPRKPRAWFDAAAKKKKPLPLFSLPGRIGIHHFTQRADARRSATSSASLRGRFEWCI